MATISYKCDTCKRDTELVENMTGFTIIGKCNITEGCLGRLYKTARNPNNVRESSPTFVEGLSNYVPRRALMTFNQTLPSDIWEVTHDMGVLPATFLYKKDIDGKLSFIDNELYTVSAINKDKIIITLPEKMTGTVQCVARSTVPQIPNILPPLDTLRQVSANGIFTFAVPKYITYTSGDNMGNTFNVCASSKPIRLEIEIARPNEEPFVCFETITDQLHVKSPWNTWNEILVTKRKNYCVKSFEILKMRIFGTADLKVTDIPNGTRIRFLRVDYGDGIVREINSRSMLALLANAPYQYADKVKDYLVDIGELKGSQPDYFVYMDGEIMVDQTMVEKSYPDINRVIK